MNLYVLLGKPVYRRWFLDGSDPDVRLVGLYVSSLFNVGSEAREGGGGGLGERGRGLAWFFMPYPYFRISKDFARQRLPFFALSNS